jgi:hypothetical protein
MPPRPPLHRSNLDLVSYMLSAFPQSIKMRQRSGTALFMARRSNHNEIVKLLVRAPIGVAVHAHDDDAAAPLSQIVLCLYAGLGWTGRVQAEREWCQLCYRQGGSLVGVNSSFDSRLPRGSPHVSEGTGRLSFGAIGIALELHLGMARQGRKGGGRGKARGHGRGEGGEAVKNFWLEQ